MNKPIRIIVICTITIFFISLPILPSEKILPYIIVFLPFTGLVVLGFIKGNRLAWRWGRIFGLIWAIFGILRIFSILSPMGSTLYGNIHPTIIVLIVIYSLLLFVIVFTLGIDGAREHFNLICRNCGSKRIKAGDFLFKKVICKECGKKW